MFQIKVEWFEGGHILMLLVFSICGRIKFMWGSILFFKVESYIFVIHQSMQLEIIYKKTINLLISKSY